MIDDEAELADVTSGKGDGAVSIRECIGKTLLLDEAKAFCVPDVYLLSVAVPLPLLRFKADTVSSSVELNIRHPGFAGGCTLLFVFKERLDSCGCAC